MKSLQINKLVRSTLSTLVLILLFTDPNNNLLAQQAPILKFYPDDPSKTIILNMIFYDDTIVLDSSSVSLRPAAGYTDSPKDLRLQVTDVYKAETHNFTLPDRLTMRRYNNDGSHDQVRLTSIESALRIPFASDSETVVISNERNNTELLSVPLKQTIHDFCIDHLDDPDCYESDLEILSIEAVDQPPLVLFGQSIGLLIRTSLVNNGPESPTGGVDAIFNQQAISLSPGISLTPPGVTDQQEFGLLVGAVRENDQTYTVTCLEPGEHQLQFTSSVHPLSAAVIDLDSTNDSKQKIVTIDCAIPVTINNKPHSFPNSLNTEKQGEYPVAVLTTEAGEYGNPLAVDAQSIIANTVRFGEPVLSANGNGAPESHGIIHIKNSYELDDKTKDSDHDVILHFSTSETGLTTGDTEACVIGKLIYNGNPVTFFGCDSVNVVN